jgi:hypothetical protein
MYNGRDKFDLPDHYKNVVGFVISTIHPALMYVCTIPKRIIHKLFQKLSLKKGIIKKIGEHYYTGRYVVFSWVLKSKLRYVPRLLSKRRF